MSALCLLCRGAAWLLHSLTCVSTLIVVKQDRKSTRLNSSHTEIYTLSLHDALPISEMRLEPNVRALPALSGRCMASPLAHLRQHADRGKTRSEEHTSELQSHRDLHSFPTRRSSDLGNEA